MRRSSSPAEGDAAIDRDPPDRRWPRGMYGRGTEPDPRFSLANERTFLAWSRTALALLGGAAAVETLNVQLAGPLERVVAVILTCTGLVCSVGAWFVWCRTEDALRQNRRLLGNPLAVFLAIGVSATGVCVLISLAIDVGR